MDRFFHCHFDNMSLILVDLCIVMLLPFWGVQKQNYHLKCTLLQRVNKMLDLLPNNSLLKPYKIGRVPLQFENQRIVMNKIKAPHESYAYMMHIYWTSIHVHHQSEHTSSAKQFILNQLLHPNLSVLLLQYQHQFDSTKQK